MSDLILDVRMDGHDSPIGILKQSKDGVMSFNYADNYRGRQLSFSMQHQRDPFSNKSCEVFFGNLLQENNSVIKNIYSIYGIKGDDIGGLLYYLGKDCPGAISVLPEGSPPVKIPGNFETDYERIRYKDIVKLVKALCNEKSIPKIFNGVSPIAGVQPKLALTILPDGSFAQPVAGSGAPTTHILKVSAKQYKNETILEEYAMSLAQKIGIETAKVESMEIGGINTLLVERYDREINSDGHIIRLHQEDFAQALGILSSEKYEIDGKEVRFDAKSIGTVINNPVCVGMREEFITATIFDLMIGNNDGHAKNFSLMQRDDGAFKFTPRYDLVPTRMFENIDPRLAYSIGNAKTMGEITADDFDMFLADLGVGPTSRGKLRDRIVTDLGNKIANELDTLENDFADFITLNIHSLFVEFDLEMPEPIQSRMKSAFGFEF